MTYWHIGRKQSYTRAGTLPLGENRVIWCTSRGILGQNRGLTLDERNAEITGLYQYRSTHETVQGYSSAGQARGPNRAIPVQGGTGSCQFRTGTVGQNRNTIVQERHTGTKQGYTGAGKAHQNNLWLYLCRRGTFGTTGLY